jgi:vancomycin permeability regulator SanA
MASWVKRLVLWLVAGVAAFGCLANAWVWAAGWGRFHADPSELPAGSIVVLLGTNEFLADQRTPSGTYRARIEAIELDRKVWIERLEAERASKPRARKKTV